MIHISTFINLDTTMGMKGSLLLSLCLVNVMNADISTTFSGTFCCLKKVVTNSENPDFDGTYIFKEDVGASKNPNCHDGCIYIKAETSQEFCFQQVSSGASTIDDQCDASTESTTAGGATSPGSSPGASGESTTLGSSTVEPNSTTDEGINSTRPSRGFTHD